jgi:hypothetical protein
MSMKLLTDKDLWDRFIDESTNGTLFHKWDFLKIVEKYTGYRLYTCGIYLDGGLAGVLPFFLRMHRGLRTIVSPPPLPMANVPYLGPAMGPSFHERRQHEKILAWDRIVKELDRGLKALSPNYISMGLTSDINDVRPFTWKNYEIDLQYTYVIDLERPLKEIWNGFDRDCRKNIIECMKYPMSIKQVSDIDRFNEIMKGHLTRDGPTFYHQQNPEYLRELLDAYPGNIKMYFFYNGGEVVGVKVNMGYRQHYMSWMGNVSLHKGLSTNEFFYWQMIKSAKDEGYKRHENYGTINKRLNVFKAKFNPTLEPCFYVQKKDGLYRVAERSYNMVNGIANIVTVK